MKIKPFLKIAFSIIFAYLMVSGCYDSCNDCDGTGVCFYCGGDGGVSAGICPKCAGDGECPYCTGTGKRNRGCLGIDPQ